MWKRHGWEEQSCRQTSDEELQKLLNLEVNGKRNKMTFSRFNRR